MANIYRIGVKIAATNGVSSVLRVMQKDFFGLNKTIDLTKGKLTGLKLATVGAMAAMGGLGMLGAFKGLADAGGKLLNQQQLMISNGTAQRDLALEMAAAYKMVSIGGSNLVDNVKMVADLRQLLGGKNLGEAIGLAPIMMRAGIAAGLMTKQGSEQSAYNIALVEDNLGYTLNAKTGQMDPARAAKQANLIDAIISGTNGRVTPDMLLAFAKQARTGGRLLTDQGFMDMAPVIQAMGGQRAGTGLTAFDRAFVGGVMTTRGTSWLERLGLINRKDVHKAESGYVKITPGSIAGSSVMAKDPQAWANQYLMPALQKLVGPRGNLQDMLTAVLQSGLANTTNGFLAELIGNQVQNAKDVQNIQQAAGTNQYSAAMQSMAGAQLNFHTALFGTPDSPGGLMAALGLPAAKTAVQVLNYISTGVRDFTQWVGAHPESAKIIDATLLGLGVALTVLGTAAVAVGIIGMVGTGGTLAALAIGITTVAAVLTATNWKVIGKDVDAAITSVEHSIQRFAYDLLHPAQLLKDITPPTPAYVPPSNFARGPHGSTGSGGITTQDVHAELKKLNDWAQNGAPVTVTNPGDIAKSSAAVALRNLHQGLAAPTTGSTGFNPRQTPSGSAAIQMPGSN